TEARMALERGKVLEAAGRKVVQSPSLVTLLEKRFAQMRTNEPCPASDEHSHGHPRKLQKAVEFLSDRMRSEMSALVRAELAEAVRLHQGLAVYLGVRFESRFCVLFIGTIMPRLELKMHGSKSSTVFHRKPQV